ncbi:MAG: alanine racemase, partial [Candidatus Omnitrophica bacterium]|nr:alanine racemase [Candidatus Omnitrophota bacterium]
MTAKEIHDAEYSAWAEVDLKAIRDNVTAIRRLAAKNKFALPTRYKGKKAMADPARLLAVIKADAYGHGMKEIAQLLFDMDVEFFAVSDVTEGAYLRQMGITTPVLLFESALLENIEQIVDLDFTPTVLTIDFARELNAYAKKFKKRINIHVNIDTGMGRLGVWHEEAEDFIKTLFTFSQITVQGIYTHFPAADNDEQFTKQQLECFYQLVVNLDRQGLVIPYVHAANSMGLAGYKTDFLNIVRPGLMLYGLYPDERFKKRLKLKPAL